MKAKRPMRHNTLISVVMPVFNEEEYLSSAIRSILRQTYTRFEFIIVDDGSTDKTSQILKHYARKDKRIKVITFKHNQGLAKALNTGIRAAKGQYLARMDADDVAMPTRFAKQIAFLKSNPDIVAIGAQAELIDKDGNRIGMKSFPYDPEELKETLFVAMPIQHPLLMTYTKLMKKCLYDESDSTAEDVNMFFQLLAHGKFSNHPDVLLQYRIREDSNSLKDARKTFYLTMKARLKGIFKYGYKPSLKGIIVNVAQAAVVFTLPKSVVLALYKYWRFKKEDQPRLAYLPSA